MKVVATYEQTWACPFNRDDLLRIWAHAEDTSLETEDEKRAFKLLSVYNGACPVQCFLCVDSACSGHAR